MPNALGQVWSYAYVALNRRTNMVDSVGTTSWRHDAMGRLVGESGPFGTPEVQVAYDPNGRLTNVTWGAFSVDYAFDDLGRIVSVAAPEGTYAFTYLSNGIRRATVSYPNGVTEVRAHDALARCTSLAFLSGTNPLLSIAYAYDDGDRRTNETWSTGRAMSYGYDDAHQLTSVAASRPSDGARYRYDAAGNPVDRAELDLDVTNSFNNLNQIVTGSWTGATLTVAGSVNYPTGSISVNNTPGTVYPDTSFDVPGVPVSPGTNILTATYVGPAFTNVPMTATDTSTVVLGDTTYTHDANGNLTSDATFTYQYDLANQLTNVTRKSDSAVVLQCRYDALGRRVEAIRADGTGDRYVYFPGSFLVLAVLDATNAPKEFYTRGPDLSGTLDSAGGIGGILACTYTSGPVLYHHADLMGNVIALTDSSASLLSIFRYTPFGQLFLFFGTVHPRYLFSSKEWDADVSLIYYGYRYYSPSVMRWTTRDALLEVSHINLYCGNRNDFINNVDFWGLHGQRGWYPPVMSPTPDIIDITGLLEYLADTVGSYKLSSDFDALMEKGREECNSKFRQWLNDGYSGPTFVDPDAKLSPEYEGIHCCVIILTKEISGMQGQYPWHYLDYVLTTFYPCTTCAQAEVEEKKKMSLHVDELTPPNVQYEEIMQFIPYNTLPSFP